MKLSEEEKLIRKFSACEKLVIIKIKEEAKKRNPNWELLLSIEDKRWGNAYVLFDKEKDIKSDYIKVKVVYSNYGFKSETCGVVIKYALTFNNANAHGRIQLKEDCKIKPEKFIENLLDTFEQYVEKKSVQRERNKKREEVKKRCDSIEKKLNLYTWWNHLELNQGNYNSYLLVKVDSVEQAADILKRSKKLPWLKFRECKDDKAEKK